MSLIVDTDNELVEFCDSTNTIYTAHKPSSLNVDCFVNWLAIIF